MYLASKNIGALWFGIGKTETPPFDGLNFVIMIAISKIDDEIKIFRYKKPGKRGIMPVAQVVYYNQIDIGIFLCFMSLCLVHNNIAFDIKLNKDNGCDNEMTLTAVYTIQH